MPRRMLLGPPRREVKREFARPATCSLTHCVHPKRAVCERRSPLALALSALTSLAAFCCYVRQCRFQRRRLYSPSRSQKHVADHLQAFDV
mmetsp:Transcript_90009/g.250492  ORF Transcript_90009/g.250492 Transcript_90009/m.250492 type:complete len:90 (+) Transcript_90009:403-672(+)